MGIPTMLDDLFHLIFCTIITIVGFGRRHYPWYLFSNATLNTKCTFITGGSSNLAALCPIICSTLNSPMYYGQSFPGLAFSFKCFIDNSILSPGPISDFFLTLSARCLSTFACFVSSSWTSIHNLYNFNR